MDVKAVRKKAKLTQLQLAVLLGRDPSFVSRIERGAVAPGDKDLDILEALQRTLKKKTVPALARILRDKGRLSAIQRLAVS